MVRIALSALVAASLAAQNNTQPQADEKKGSISGTVRDAGTGEPIADVRVSVFTNARYTSRSVQMSPTSKRVEVNTDTKGQYRLADLPPNLYSVSAFSNDRTGRYMSKMANLHPGEDLTSVDFAMAANAAITGRVLDQNKEPVPGANVYLVSKEYSFGAAGYFAKDMARTNDEGVYLLQRAQAGQPYQLYATRRTQIETHSEAPADPKLRKPAYVPTYYPNSMDPQGGAPLVLRSREQRENIDIVLQRTSSFCISGTLETTRGPAAGRLMIAGGEMSQGVSREGGLAGVPAGGGLVGDDGKFRVCDLAPGDYHVMALLQVADNGGPPQLGFAPVSIADRDVAGVRLWMTGGAALAGSVVWEGKPPDQPVPAQLSVYLTTVNRGAGFQGEASRSARSPIPGEFTIPGVLPGDYAAMIRAGAPDVYVKDVLYGPDHVLYRPLRVGSSGNAELKVVLARDGGSISVQVKDRNGKAVPNSQVVIMPAETASEPDLAERMVMGETDQDGQYSSGVLAPGKYLVLAPTLRPDHTVERTGKIWGARSRAKTVELAPNGTAQVTLEPAPIE